MLKKYRELKEILETHHQVPIIDPAKRHLGIILTLVGFLLYAFYTVLFQIETFRNKTQNSLATTFTEFTIFYLFMFLSYLPLCLPRGRRFLKCKKPKLIILRAALSIICVWFYSLARVWTSHVDNSMLYSTDAFWVVLIMFMVGIKVNWIAWLGVIIGSVGIIFIYSFDYFSIHDLVGGTFGLISGITLGVVIFMTSYMVQKDPPLRICLYQSLIGFVVSAIIAIFLSIILGWEIPRLNAVILMMISGVLFALTLFCFIEAFYYTESYIIGGVSLLLPVFIESINWVLNQNNVPYSTIIWSLILALGTIITIYSSRFCDKKRVVMHNYK